MSLKKVHDSQPKEFKFSSENLKKAEEILKRYPEKNKKPENASKSKKDKLSDALRVNLLKRKEFQKKIKDKD